VLLHNELPESTAIHWHGILVPNAMDGVPDVTQPPVKPGETFVYEFVARETAVGMYHSHHNSAKQVSNGLAGAFLVDRLPMPDGRPVDVEYTMMLNDSGTIGFSLNGKSFPATEALSVARGDRVLVHYMNEGVMAHPMHLHGMHALVVAKDGKPLPAPYAADTIDVAPGERYSILVDASEPGTWVWHCHILTHAEAETGMFGMVTAMVVT
jgi:manganese oxidase